MQRLVLLAFKLITKKEINVAYRTLLKYRNLDLTKDINDKFTYLFAPGVFYGGLITPVTGQLKVEINAPWKLISKDGMVIEETSTNTRLVTPVGQKTVIAVKVVYQDNDEPIIIPNAIELSAFELLPDKDYYVIFALVDVPADATIILESYIRYAERNIVDMLGRGTLRDVVTNSSFLPNSKDNIAGDLYVVANGIGGIPHIYGWDGFSWIILTDAATVTANLATHRQNLYVDEKHATDDEKEAMIGTSGTAPSALNPFVDNEDTRIPTQNENNALQGTDGTPADYNRYITEEYPWAVPEEKVISTPLLIDIATRMYGATSEGPIYIGRGDSFSTPTFFKFYDSLLNREYTTSPTHPTNPNTIVTITGVYFDSLCTMLVDPLVSTDLDGFCTQDLYLKWNVVPDTEFRVLYAKREVMKRKQTGDPPQFYHPYPDAIIRRKVNDAQISATLIKYMEDIKGRDFDDVPPTVEQNINLRRYAVDGKEYLGSNFKTDSVVNSFESLENVPAYVNDFPTNVGIPQNYSFENSLLSPITYSYNLTLNEGTVTYSNVSVDFSAVIANQDVFIDGSLNEYKIVNVNTGTRAIKIQKRDGKVPRSINTTLMLSGSLTLDSKVVANITPSTSGLVANMAIHGNANIPSGTLIYSVDSLTQITLTKAATITSLLQSFVAAPGTLQSNYYLKGSIKKDNNPRKINLATLDYVLGKSRIYCRQIQPVLNEFHPVTKNVAYEISMPLHSITRKEPRIRFYGGFKNKDAGTRSRIVNTNNGIISITGFFTDVLIILDLKNSSPTFLVKVDGDPTGTTVTPVSAPNTIADSNGFENEFDFQNQYFKIVSGLADLVPHTIEIHIGNTASDLIVYGFDLIRNTISNVMVLPGRSFSQADLFLKNVLDNSVAVPRGGIGGSYVRGKGLISTRYINRNGVESTQNTSMLDMDGDDDTTCPKGTASNGVPTFGPSTGLSKFAYYQVGDIVKLINYDGSSIPILEQVLVINTITGSSATFTTNITTDGPPRTAILLHVVSTTGDTFDTLKEFNRYMFTELGVKQSSDFSYLVQYASASSKLYTLEDGTTSIMARNTKYVNTGIDGADFALNMVDNTSSLRIRTVASRLDLLVVNTASVSGVLISIDGSPSYSVNFSGGGLTKYTVWTNARYQTHEVYINNASGLDIIGFITYEPTHNVKIEGSLLATQNIIANYDTSVSTSGNIIPTGCIAVDPYKMGGVYVNSTGVGTDWTTIINYTSNPYWGRYSWTSKVSSYFEYTLLGQGFEIEFLSNNDRRIAEVYINGVLATSSNWGSAIFKNVNSTNGQVDMYELVGGRKKFGINNLPFNVLTIRILCTALSNPSSTGTGGINIVTVYEINTSGYLSYSPSKGVKGKTGIDDFIYGPDWVKDERVFDCLPSAKEDKPSILKLDSQTIVLEDIRTDKILLSPAEYTKNILFTSPFSNNDYYLECSIYKYDTLGTAVLIIVTPSNILANGFTADFTTIPVNGTYYLIYKATKYF